MPLTFKSENTSQEILDNLKSMFPEYVINKKRKNVIYVRNGKLLAIVKLNSSNSTLSVYGDFNMKNPVIIFWLILGVILTIVGLAIILIILYAVHNKQIKNFRQKIYNSIVDE